MNDQPTPETNKFRSSLDGMREINQRDRLLSHARRLERERDEASDSYVNAVNQLAAERALADRLAEALRKCVLWAEGASNKLIDREHINWSYLEESRKNLTAWKEARKS